MCLGLRPSFIDSVLENGVLLCHGCGKLKIVTCYKIGKFDYFVY